jgi:hypothetical protein
MFDDSFSCTLAAWKLFIPTLKDLYVENFRFLFQNLKNMCLAVLFFTGSWAELTAFTEL